MQFLTSIPMVNERARLQRLQQEQQLLQQQLLQQHQQQGDHHHHHHRQDRDATQGTRPGAEEGRDEDDDEDGGMLLDSPVAVSSRAYDAGEPVVPGKQLEGPAPALVVAVPAAYRHRYLRSAAVMRQWEEGLVRREGLLDGRLFLTSGRNYPWAVASVISYRPGAEEDKRLRLVCVCVRGCAWRCICCGKA